MPCHSTQQYRITTFGQSKELVSPANTILHSSRLIVREIKTSISKASLVRHHFLPCPQLPQLQPKLGPSLYRLPPNQTSAGLSLPM